MICAFSQGQIAVSLPENAEENETLIRYTENEVEITWPIKDVETCRLVLDLKKGKPIFRSMAIGKDGSYTTIASDIEPVFLLNVGNRTLKPENGWTIFSIRCLRGPIPLIVSILKKMRWK